MSEYIVDVNDSSEMYAAEMGRYEELRELIRCKDCKKNPTVSFVGCPLAAISRTDDDFCSRAERREE